MNAHPLVAALAGNFSWPWVARKSTIRGHQVSVVTTLGLSHAQIMEASQAAHRAGFIVLRVAHRPAQTTFIAIPRDDGGLEAVVALLTSKQYQDLARVQ